MKKAIAGTGYVGLSNGVLLAQHNSVVVPDVISEKVAMTEDNSYLDFVVKELKYLRIN